MISLFIPIDVINAKFPGGFAAYLKTRVESNWIPIVHDRYLVREEFMGPLDAESREKWWADFGILGLQGEQWINLCCVPQFSNMFGNCEWLSVGVIKTPGGREKFVGHRDDLLCGSGIANMPIEACVP